VDGLPEARSTRVADAFLKPVAAGETCAGLDDGRAHGSVPNRWSDPMLVAWQLTPPTLLFAFPRVSPRKPCLPHGSGYTHDWPALSPRVLFCFAPLCLPDAQRPGSLLANVEIAVWISSTLISFAKRR